MKYDSENDPALWKWRRVPRVRRRDHIIIYMLVGAGFIFTFRFLDWWFRPEHVEHIFSYVLLSLALWYGVLRMILGWINAMAIKRAPHIPAPEDMKVAIFTTSSPGEPLSMFEKTLEACSNIEYPHTTYLLDDTEDPRFRRAAERHGAVWLELVGIPGAKAGKINAALELTDEDFILVLDPDHIPFPNFLDRVLGQFTDPEVGFVQVVQAYYNQPRTFTAHGAAEQTYTFYGPTQMGLNGLGCAVAIGANCTFRRRALESIGGHGIGLAEDLVTSIRLHSEGWKSVYVPEIVSRGIVPEDAGSFYKQQLKWARGVYEVLFSELPRAFKGLSWLQRLAYGAISTYYIFGVTTLFFLLVPYIFVWGGSQPASMDFGEFILNGGPIAIIGVLLYLYQQRWLADTSHERGLHWRALSLKIACWPVYFAGTVLAVIRADIPYIPTAKEAQKGHFFRLAWPHLALTTLFWVSLAVIVYQRLFLEAESVLLLTSQAVWGMMAFAAWAALFTSGGIYAAYESLDPPRDVPWENVNVEEIEACEKKE